MLRWLYNETIRPYLPRKVIVHNGVPARTGYLLDSTDHRENWKKPLLNAIRDQSLEGRKIVEVGGGTGICTAELAKRSSRKGEVISYEADADSIETMEETLKLNKVRDIVTVREEYLKSVDIPCDILVLDCEGSEKNILEREHGNPKTVIVETHPSYGVSNEVVQEILTASGYTNPILHNGSETDVIEAHL